MIKTANLGLILSLVIHWVLSLVKVNHFLHLTFSIHVMGIILIPFINKGNLYIQKKGDTQELNIQLK